MEIGSEYWKKNISLFEDNAAFYLSGRTALYEIIQDAIKNYAIDSVLLPSYCCNTMIEPFIRSNISIRFYDIYVNNDNKLCAEIPEPQENEAIYIIRYFGFSDITYLGDGKALRGWIVTIEDMTHSCFIKDYQSDADYFFMSYRKWFAVDGVAMANKQKGMSLSITSKINSEYCKLRNTAYELKNRFMEGEKIEKQNYLSLFSEAETLLEDDYIGYASRNDSIRRLCLFINQIEEVRSVRRKNAQILYEGLQNLANISIIRFCEENDDCPLFVPILVENNKRDKLRRYLIENEVYCPIHWPLTEYHLGITERAKELYNKELSLVCDQRYNKNEMYKIVRLIQIFDTL